MNLAVLANELNQLRATELCSLARHVEGEATPWVSPSTYKGWRQIKAMAHASDEVAARLSKLLAELHLPEAAPSYPVRVAEFHFTSMGLLLPLVLDEKHRQVAAYERALALGASDPMVSAELRDLLGQTKAQVHALEELVKTLAIPATATYRP